MDYQVLNEVFKNFYKIHLFSSLNLQNIIVVCLAYIKMTQFGIRTFFHTSWCFLRYGFDNGLHSPLKPTIYSVFVLQITAVRTSSLVQGHLFLAACLLPGLDLYSCLEYDKKFRLKKRKFQLFEEKIFRILLSLFYPWGTQGFPKKMSAHSVLPVWPAIANIFTNIYERRPLLSRFISY